MSTVNIHAAKTHLSRLLDEVAAGGEVVIARAGRPIARLIPFEPTATTKPKRVLGQMDGQFNIPDDFDTMFQDEIIAMFEGS